MSLDKDKRNLNQCPLKYFVENTNKTIKFNVSMATGVLPDGRAVVGFTLDRARIHAAALARYARNCFKANMYKIIAEDEVPAEDEVQVYRDTDPYSLMYIQNDGTFEFSENGLLPQGMQIEMEAIEPFADDGICLVLTEDARYVEGQLNQYDKIHINKILAYTARGFLADEVSVININDGSNVRKYSIGTGGKCDIDFDARNEVMEIETTIATQENEFFDDEDTLIVQVSIDKLKGVLF